MSENLSFPDYLEKVLRAQPLFTGVVVLTDIVGSTSLARSLPAKEWKKMLERHLDKARFYKDRYEGYELGTTGDGVMLAFPTGDKGADFATSFEQDTGDPLIRIRVGIEFGTVLRLNDFEVCGVMLHHLARILDLMENPGIIMTAAAKTDIDRQLGAEVERLGIQPFPHPPIRDFENEDEVLYEIVNPVAGRCGC